MVAVRPHLPARSRVPGGKSAAKRCSAKNAQGGRSTQERKRDVRRQADAEQKQDLPESATSRRAVAKLVCCIILLEV
jgi:hypothetical protein